MSSPEFQGWLDRLIEWAPGDDTVIMCAEAVPWRCHRQLIADALVAKGVRVTHIVGEGRTTDHELNPHAVEGADGVVTYPATPDSEQQSLF